MANQIHVEIPTTTVLTVRNAQMLPYLDLRPLRTTFAPPEPKLKLHKSQEHDINELIEWAKKQEYRGQVLELQFPFQDWQQMRERAQVYLSDPRNKAALFFVAGKNFNSVTGHPVGTELFLIDDVIYRRLTWRSITLKYWDKKKYDTGITWKTDNLLTYFLWKCEKINEPGLKNAITEGIGAELLERDRPKRCKDAESV